MKNTLLIFFLAATLFCNSCTPTEKKNSDVTVKIETEFGDILIKLYDETPLHRDNFVKLAQEGFYDDLLFHRVIKGFMVQGGDPDSKDAASGVRLGGGDTGYTIPAEFDTKFFHKKGALAAARQGDAQNPERRSSGSQFYIVQGKTFSNEEIDDILQRQNQQYENGILRKYYKENEDELNKLRSDGKQQEFALRMAKLREDASNEAKQNPPFSMSDEKIEAYKTIGGYPSLDGNYTVFGEVIEGLEVIDKIAEVNTDQADRPQNDIKMKVTVID